MTCRFHSFITSFSPSFTSVNSSSCCKKKKKKEGKCRNWWSIHFRHFEMSSDTAVMSAGSSNHCWRDKNVAHGCKSKLKNCSVLAIVFAMNIFKLFMGNRADPNALTLCCHGNLEYWFRYQGNIFMFFLLLRFCLGTSETRPNNHFYHFV